MNIPEILPLEKWLNIYSILVVTKFERIYYCEVNGTVIFKK